MKQSISLHLPSLLLGIFACLCLVFFGSAAWQDEDVPGRYQITSGNSSSVFVLDSKTGAVIKLYLDDFGPDNIVSSRELKNRLKKKEEQE